MAEELVLSNLRVDSSGVVSGVNETNAALTRGDAALRKFGTVQTSLGANTALLTSRLTSARLALVTLGRAFGITSLILGVAFALSGLVKELITNTNWFKRLKEAVTDWWLEMVKGETSLDRLSRKLKEFGSGAVISNINQAKELVKRLQELRRQMHPVRELAALGSAEATSLIDIGRVGGAATPTSSPAPLDPLAMAVAKAEVISTQREMNKLIDSLEEAGVTGVEAFGLIRRAVPPTREEIKKFQDIAAEGILGDGGLSSIIGKPASVSELIAFFERLDKLASEGIGGPETGLRGESDLARIDRFFSMAGLPPPEMIFNAIKEVDDAVRAIMGNIAFLSEGQVHSAIGSLAGQYEALGLSADEAAARIKALTDIALNKSAWEEFTESIQKSVSAAKLAVDLLNAALNAFVSSLASQLLSGSLSVKKLMAAMLESLVPVLLAYAALALVKGIIFEDARSLAAAGIAFAAAIAAASAARALGGSGGQSTSTGASGTSATNAVEGSPRQLIKVNVTGFVGDEDALARDIARWIATAQTDGSR